MMSGDCQSQSLAEWLHSLGWNGSFQLSNLRKLNTPKMRSIWRHLQTQVVPIHVANTIRKNLLLSKLEEENIFVGQYRNCKLDSVNQLSKVKEILKLEKEKDQVKEEIKIIDYKLQNELSSFLQNSNLIECMKHKMGEIEDKTVVLELKNDQLLKDCRQVNADLEIAEQLKSFKTSISHSEKNYQKLVVCNYVKNYKYPSRDIDDESDYLCEMLAAIVEFKSHDVLSGITQAAKDALCSLNTKVDVSRGNLSSDKFLTFRRNLRDLQVLIVQKELHMSECLKQISFESDQLKQEKEELLRFLADKVENIVKLEKFDESGFESLAKENFENFYKNTGEELNAESRNENSPWEVLDDLLQKIKEGRKNKIREEKLKQLPDYELELAEDLKQSINVLAAREDEIWLEVEKKVSDIKTVTSKIFNGLVDSGELNELLAQILQLASNFKTEASQMCFNNIDVGEMNDLLLKAIEVFKGTPMIAFDRKWCTSNEEQLFISTRAKSDNHKLGLINFILQSEKKNLVLNVLEKYIWSFYVSPQLH